MPFYNIANNLVIIPLSRLRKIMKSETTHSGAKGLASLNMPAVASRTPASGLWMLLVLSAYWWLDVYFKIVLLPASFFKCNPTPPEYKFRDWVCIDITSCFLCSYCFLFHISFSFAIYHNSFCCVNIILGFYNIAFTSMINFLTTDQFEILACSDLDQSEAYLS